MQISADKVVHFHYTLRNDAGEKLDSSEGKEPLPYLHGHQNLIRGLEAGLEGLSVGDKKLIIVPPETGYGVLKEDAIQEVSLSAFPEEFPREIGYQFFAENPNESAEEKYISYWIVEVKEHSIVVDENHPLAGETLHFDVEIVEIRAAEEEELAHGHVHGPGGHEH